MQAEADSACADAWGQDVFLPYNNTPLAECLAGGTTKAPSGRQRNNPSVPKGAFCSCSERIPHAVFCMACPVLTVLVPGRQTFHVGLGPRLVCLVQFVIEVQYPGLLSVQCHLYAVRAVELGNGNAHDLADASDSRYTGNGCTPEQVSYIIGGGIHLYGQPVMAPSPFLA